MKKTTTLFRLLAVAALASLIAASSGCKTTSNTERPQVFTVVGLGGAARFRVGLSNEWCTLKLGNYLPQDSVIQTASGSENYVILAAGKHQPSTIGYSPQPYSDAGKLILYEYSTLKITKITTRTVGRKKIPDTRLSLLAGAALCGANTVWPTDTGFSVSTSKVENISPEPDKQYYEIRSSNVVVHAEHAIFFFTASGLTRGIRGTVKLEFPSSDETKDLFASQQYDPGTGQIIQFDPQPFFEGPRPIPSWRRPRDNPFEETVPQLLF